MARYSRIQVAQTMSDTGMIPVFYHKNINTAKQVLKACYNGGVRVFEFTNRGDFAHEIFAELNKWAAQETPEMILGVGSVLDPATASLYIQLGANFIVSPILNPEVIKVCNRRKILCSPGCGSVSEISYAEELGVEVVKIFPGLQVGGPEFVRAIKGPMPWASIMPTGGVSTDEDNLKKWFNAGVHCVGIGSKLILKSYLEEGNYKALEQKVREVIETIKKLK